jgi:hypothetical protein
MISLNRFQSFALAFAFFIVGGAQINQPVSAQNFANPVSEINLEQRLEETERRLLITENQLQLLRQSGADLAMPIGKPDQLNQDDDSLILQTGIGEFDADGCKPTSECDSQSADSSLEQYAWNKDGGWRIVPFGSATVETIYTSDQTTSRPFILYVAPRVADRQKQFTVTGQSTSLGLRVSGPPIGSFQTGGLLLFDFHGDRPIFNESSPYFLRGYGEIFNEQWRFAFGQNADIVAPGAPVTVNWTSMNAAGNFGNAQRGQLRLDRYFDFGETARWTITGGISQQVVSDFIDVPVFNVSDNGVPNVEARISVALGVEEDGSRPIELGLSGVAGELIDIDNFGPLVVDTWGAALDFRLSGQRVGLAGEFFSGQGIGTYNGAINQTLNQLTAVPIGTIGGWGQLWCKPFPRVTTAVGYGIDDPDDEDLGPVLDGAGNVTGGQRSRNQVLFATLLWDVTDALQFGLEYSHWETDYIAPSIDNQADAFFSRITLKF